MYEQIDKILILIKDMVVIACPVILAIFTYKSTKREKEDKKYRVLKEKLDAEREKRKKENDEELNKTINDMKTSIDSVKSSVEEINIKEVEKQLNDLVQLNGINLEYSQSLSTVVVKMADYVRGSQLDQNAKDDIAKAIEAHQNKEKDITKKIYQFTY